MSVESIFKSEIWVLPSGEEGEGGEDSKEGMNQRTPRAACGKKRDATRNKSVNVAIVSHRCANPRNGKGAMRRRSQTHHCRQLPVLPPTLAQQEFELHLPI